MCVTGEALYFNGTSWLFWLNKQIYSIKLSMAFKLVVMMILIVKGKNTYHDLHTFNGDPPKKIL